MLRIALCDDDPTVIQEYAAQLKEICKRHELEASFFNFSNGEQLLFYLADSPNLFEIIFLDILMKHTSGIQVARTLRDLHCRSQIIFLTTSEEYVFDSFEALPLSYLVKDTVTQEKLESVFLKAAERALEHEEASYVVTSSSVTKSIPLSHISHFEVKNRIITVYYDDQTFDFYSKLDTVEQELAAKGFLRTHRSFLVNCAHIDRIEKTDLYLRSGARIPISSKHYRDVKENFSKYLITE